MTDNILSIDGYDGDTCEQIDISGTLTTNKKLFRKKIIDQLIYIVNDAPDATVQPLATAPPAAIAVPSRGCVMALKRAEATPEKRRPLTGAGVRAGRRRAPPRKRPSAIGCSRRPPNCSPAMAMPPSASGRLPICPASRSRASITTLATSADCTSGST